MPSKADDRKDNGPTGVALVPNTDFHAASASRVLMW